MNESRNTTVGGSADADAKQKTIVLAFDRAALSGDAADQDIIAQLDAIEKAVKENGYSPLRLPVTLDLEHLGSRLRGFKPDLVFNLVESLDRSDRLQTLVPLVLEDWNILFTGCGSSAMLLSNNKLASKQLLADKGLPVPDCVYLGADGSPRVIVATGGDEGEAEKKTRQGWNQPSDNQTGIRIENRRWMIKAVESHASVHLDDHSVASFASLRH
ncbi:MAG: hypothetical protein LIP23_07260, partial [Planctomycetes bacterium]|nr:hypothetical protein [Planctomycetota bacterium]